MKSAFKPMIRRLVLLMAAAWVFLAFSSVSFCETEDDIDVSIMQQSEISDGAEHEENSGSGEEAAYGEDLEYIAEPEYEEEPEYGAGLEYEDSEYSEYEEYNDTYEDESGQEEVPYSRARVLRVLNEINEVTDYSGGSFESNVQLLEVLITKGPHQGEKVQAEYELSFTFNGKYKSPPLSPGDEVLLFLEEGEDGTVEYAYVAEFVRDKYLLYLVIGFAVLLLLVGRMKGLKAIISLALTAAAVVKILLPAILKGWDPVIVSVGICIGIICITMLIISGANKKTFAAIIGTAGGVAVAGIIALVIGSLAMLTGFGDDESQMLMYIPQEIQFDFRGLLFCGIIIGTMGATMDVGMSIASAMHEIKVNSPRIKTSDLIRAGMNVGRDAMATMSNTLILAYVGSSLHLMLLFMAHKTPFAEIINWDMIASEVLRAIAGSIGIIIAIPITALASAFIREDDRKKKNDYGMDFRSL